MRRAAASPGREIEAPPTGDDGSPPEMALPPPHATAVALADALCAHGHRASVPWGVEVRVQVSATRTVSVRCETDDEPSGVVVYRVRLNERHPSSLSQGDTISLRDVEAAVQCWADGSSLADAESCLPFLGHDRRLLERVSRDLTPHAQHDAGRTALLLLRSGRRARVSVEGGLPHCVLDLPDGRVAVLPAGVDIVPVLRAWLTDRSPETFVSEVPDMEIRTLSEHDWLELLRETRRPGSYLRSLRALVAALVRDPLIIRFYPVTSHSTLCFSASSEYPFVARGLPKVSTDGMNRFRFELTPRDPMSIDSRPPIDPSPQELTSITAVIEEIRGVLASYPVTPFVGSGRDPLPNFPASSG